MSFVYYMYFDRVAYGVEGYKRQGRLGIVFVIMCAVELSILRFRDLRVEFSMFFLRTIQVKLSSQCSARHAHIKKHKTKRQKQTRFLLIFQALKISKKPSFGKLGFSKNLVLRN